MKKNNPPEKKHIRLWNFLFLFSFLFLCLSCEENRAIVNKVDERDANEIVVYLATKGIEAQKIEAAATEGAGGAATTTYNILVDPHKEVEAMAILNEVGLPRRQGKTLLDLFEKSGLMTTDKQEKIRYQAGLEEELKNTIRKIDGVIDTEVQISYLPDDTAVTPGQEQKKIKASVYVKHQGVFDDPNNHLEVKIRRLLAGSIDGLDFENVAVISDRSRFTDLSVIRDATSISPEQLKKDYVSIWSIIMTRSSSLKFRMIFFILIFVIILFGGIIGFFIYKYYPTITKMRREKNLPPPETTPPPSIGEEEKNE